MDIRKVKKLIELLEESGIAEIEIKEGEESVRISRHGSGSVVSGPVPVVTPVPTTDLTSAAEPVSPPVSTPEALDNVITAPMVGTFYLASSPGAAPFSATGQAVKKGDVICIIEAMKIMNQIEADRDGIIKSILVEDGQPVEFGQPLFTLD